MAYTPGHVILLQAIVALGISLLLSKSTKQIPKYLFLNSLKNKFYTVTDFGKKEQSSYQIFIAIVILSKRSINNIDTLPKAGENSSQ